MGRAPAPNPGGGHQLHPPVGLTTEQMNNMRSSIKAGGPRFGSLDRVGKQEPIFGAPVCARAPFFAGGGMIPRRGQEMYEQGDDHWGAPGEQVVTTKSPDRRSAAEQAAMRLRPTRLNGDHPDGRGGAGAQQEDHGPRRSFLGRGATNCQQGGLLGPVVNVGIARVSGAAPAPPPPRGFSADSTTTKNHPITYGAPVASPPALMPPSTSYPQDARGTPLFESRLLLNRARASVERAREERTTPKRPPHSRTTRAPPLGMGIGVPTSAVPVVGTIPGTVPSGRNSSHIIARRVTGDEEDLDLPRRSVLPSRPVTGRDHVRPVRQEEEDVISAAGEETGSCQDRGDSGNDTVVNSTLNPRGGCVAGVGRKLGAEAGRGRRVFIMDRYRDVVILVDQPFVSTTSEKEFVDTFFGTRLCGGPTDRAGSGERTGAASS